MPDLPRGTVAFLFTDLEGSTRLWGEHPAAMPPHGGAQDRVVPGIGGGHGGGVYKVIGDALGKAACSASPITL